MAHIAYLALGSNLGDRERYLRAAIALLKEAPGVNLRRCSRVYETEPVGVTEQPRFLNMVVEVDAEGTPRDLLALAKGIERELGRKGRERWGPREIDIDVLIFDDETVSDDDLKVPHPRMWERAFVMVPLAELAPEIESPTGERAAHLAARLAEEQSIHAPIRLRSETD